MVRRLAVVLVALAACKSEPPVGDAPPYPWSETTPLPEPRLEPGVAALGQRLAVYGGFDRSERDGLRLTANVIALDPVAEVWDPLEPAPVAWSHANFAAVSTTLYLLGGHEGVDFVARGESWALDTALPGATWRPLAPMPAGLERGGAAVVVSPPHIFLLGGASSTEAVTTCLDYNLTTDTWTSLPDLPAPRSHAAAMRMVDGTLLVAGGLATLDATQPYGDVLELGQGASTWEPRAGRMEVPRGGCAFGDIFGQLVCAGGEAGGAALGVTESYDPLTDTWMRLPDMPARRAGARGAVIGGRLHVVGGAARLVFEPTSTVYVLSFLDTLAP